MVAGAGDQVVGAGMTTGSDEPDVVMADAAAQAVVDGKGPLVSVIEKDTGKELLTPGAVMTEYHADGRVTSTEVPLPAPVAAQAAVMAGAAATGAPPVQEVPTTYTPNSMDGAAMAGCMEAVWKILYHHTYTKCGWQPNPQTNRFMFTNAAAVLEGVNIQHILTAFGADNFIMEYDTLDAEGKYSAELCQGMIRGRTTSKQGLPSYTLYLNIGGQRVKRSFIPQNPEKRDAQNAYTKSAELAGAGNMIVWVFKDEVPDAAPFNEKCAATIKNNVYEIMS